LVGSACKPSRPKPAEAMIDYEEDWLAPLLLKCEGSVALRASMYAVPSAILGILLVYLDEWAPGGREDLGLLDIGSSHVWNAVTAMMGILIGFRTRQALSRFWEGTGLLHQMRGEWFDTVSNCVTFSINAKKTKPLEVMKFRHTIVRLMSLAHGSALEEIAGNQVQLDTIDVFGLDQGTLRHLKSCHEKYKFNKVEVMLHLVQSLITDAHSGGILTVPPPILSRVYQTISRGFVNLLNAKKITDTRFPFPYAQLITFLLYALTVLTPMIMSTTVTSKVMCGIITFVPVFAMYSLNFIAIELENPFGVDTNDLPLEHFQSEMNSCLLMLLHTNTDLIATTSNDCMMDFDSLYKEICDAEHEGEEEDRMSSRTHMSRRKTRLSHFKDITMDDEGAGGKMSMTMDQANSLSPENTGGLGVAPPAGGPAKAAEAPTTPLTAEQKKPESSPPPAPAKAPPAASPPAPATTEAASKSIVSIDSQAPPKAVSDLQPMLSKSMNDFNIIMKNWTKMIENQVAELDRNCIALQSFSDSLGTGGKVAAAGVGWEGALPGV